MASIKIPKAWEIPGKLVTPESIYLNRRQILKHLGFSALGAAGLYWAYGSMSLSSILKRPEHCELERKSDL